MNIVSRINRNNPKLFQASRCCNRWPTETHLRQQLFSFIRLLPRRRLHMVRAETEISTFVHIAHAYRATGSLATSCWSWLREWHHFILFREIGFKTPKPKIGHTPHHLFDILTFLDRSVPEISPELLAPEVVLLFDIAFWDGCLCYLVQ